MLRMTGGAALAFPDPKHLNAVKLCLRGGMRCRARRRGVRHTIRPAARVGDEEAGRREVLSFCWPVDVPAHLSAHFLGARRDGMKGIPLYEVRQHNMYVCQT